MVAAGEGQRIHERSRLHHSDPVGGRRLDDLQQALFETQAVRHHQAGPAQRRRLGGRGGERVRVGAGRDQHLDPGGVAGHVAHDIPQDRGRGHDLHREASPRRGGGGSGAAAPGDDEHQCRRRSRPAMPIGSSCPSPPRSRMRMIINAIVGRPCRHSQADRVAEAVAALLRGEGIRFTPARRLVVRALAEAAPGPQAAGDLHAALRDRLPLSSLYRTLAVLEEARRPGQGARRRRGRPLRAGRVARSATTTTWCASPAARCATSASTRPPRTPSPASWRTSPGGPATGPPATASTSKGPAPRAGPPSRQRRRRRPRLRRAHRRGGLGLHHPRRAPHRGHRPQRLREVDARSTPWPGCSCPGAATSKCWAGLPARRAAGWPTCSRPPR